MEEKDLSEQESLELITGMINKVKSDFHENGISPLLWGGVIMFCSIVSLINIYLKIGWLDNVWWLTFVAIVPQVIVSIREGRQRQYKTHTDDAMNGIWTSFGIAIFILSIYNGVFNLPHANILFLALYGMPTFATGITHHFKPMIIGGLVCWTFAIISFFINSLFVEYILLAMAAFFAWLLPGIILRRMYLKAKRQHV